MLERYTLNELMQAMLKEGKETYALFIDVQKAYLIAGYFCWCKISRNRLQKKSSWFLFLSIVGDSINEREIRKFEEGLNNKQ